MTLSMVAPKLARLDLWVQPPRRTTTRRAALELLAEPLQATTNGTAAAERDLDLLRRLRGDRQARTPQRARCSTASWRRRLRSGSRPSSLPATAARRRARTACRRLSSTASTSSGRRPGRRRRPGCSPSAARTSRSRPRTRSRPPACGTTRYPAPYQQTAAGGGGTSTFEDRPWWQPATSSQSDLQDGPGRRRVRRRESRLRDHLLARGFRAAARARPDDLVRRRHECGRPARGRHDRPLGPAGAAVRSPQARVRPAAPVLDRAPRPGSFLDIVTGDNSVFSGVSCCTAGSGYDMASGLGSPLADQIATHLHH